MAQQHGLGRGLASLIPPKTKTAFVPTEAAAVSSSARPVTFDTLKDEEKTAIKKEGIFEIAVTSIVPNPHQPRLRFDETKLTELSESIKEHGIVQPLIVTELENGRYELIAGERRFQAAKLAGLKTVPVLVRKANENEKFELAIIENVQRHDLNPIEEAKAYRKLMDEFGLNQDAVAKKMGKSRSAVANILRFLQLPVEVQRALIDGSISEGHAKVILSLGNSEKQRALFEAVIRERLTVRETETRARETTVRSHARVVGNDPSVLEKEHRLAEILGTKVKINKAGKGGRIVIEYYAEEELAGFISRLTK